MDMLLKLRKDKKNRKVLGNEAKRLERELVEVRIEREKAVSFKHTKDDAVAAKNVLKKRLSCYLRGLRS